jgi:hypothetical protein
VETPTDADMPRKPLTLVAQLPELSHLELGQRRPTGEERRHTLVAILTGIAKLVFIEHCEVLGKVLDHLGASLSAAPCASAIWHFGRPLAE